MEPATTQELKSAIKRFLTKNRYHQFCKEPDRNLYFAEHNAELCSRFLLATIQRYIDSAENEAHRREANPEQQEQYRFLGEDFAVLFNGPDHLLPFKSGLRRQLSQMTVNQLRQSARTLRNTVSPKNLAKAKWLETHAQRMEPYARKHPGLKFGAWVELAAAGITVSR